MNSNNQSLWELIQCLTTEEKKAYTLYMKSIGEEKSATYLLYKGLSKMTVFSAQEENKLAKKVGIKNLSNAKATIWAHLTRVLPTVQKNPVIEDLLQTAFYVTLYNKLWQFDMPAVNEKFINELMDMNERVNDFQKAIMIIKHNLVIGRLTETQQGNIKLAELNIDRAKKLNALMEELTIKFLIQEKAHILHHLRNSNQEVPQEFINETKAFCQKYSNHFSIINLLTTIIDGSKEMLDYFFDFIEKYINSNYHFILSPIATALCNIGVESNMPIIETHFKEKYLHLLKLIFEKIRFLDGHIEEKSLILYRIIKLDHDQIKWITKEIEAILAMATDTYNYRGIKLVYNQINYIKYTKRDFNYSFPTVFFYPLEKNNITDVAINTMQCILYVLSMQHKQQVWGIASMLSQARSKLTMIDGEQKLFPAFHLFLKYIENNIEKEVNKTTLLKLQKQIKEVWSDDVKNSEVLYFDIPDWIKQAIAACSK